METTNVPKNRCLKLAHKIVTNPFFDGFIMICIILNMLQMAISIETSTAKFDLALSITNYFFTAVFTIEMVLKLIAFRFTYF